MKVKIGDNLPSALVFFLDNSNLFKKGASAEITIIDPDHEWIFSEENIYSKSKNSPFIGEKLKGKIHYTLSKGFLANFH